MFHHLKHGRCLGTTFLLLPLLVWRHRVGGLKPNMATVLVEHGLIFSRFLIPCPFFTTVVTLPSGGRAHTIEHLAHSVNLVLLTFQSRYILFLGVQGMQFNLIIEIGCLNCA